MRHFRRKPAAPPKVLHPRMVARGDGLRVHSIGRRKVLVRDLYVRLLATSWKQMAAVMCAFYLLINFVFAGLYFVVPGSVLNARPGSFADDFFFSVQTIATIGYGGMLPGGLYANVLVTVESMFGFAFYGVVTGLVFSRFSRPTARVMFSDKAVIGMHDGKRQFMLRLANERENRIVDARAKLTLMRDEETKEGQLVRRFYDLALVREQIPVLRLTWTLRHIVDESSPLHHMSEEALNASEAEIIVSLSGIDETLSQTIHARHSYIADEIYCGATFVDILTRTEDYALEVRYDKFHDIVVKEEDHAAETPPMGA